VTTRTSGGITLDRFGEIDVHLIGQARDPGQNIAEFVHLGRTIALPDRLRQFTHFFGQPGHRGRNTACAISISVGELDDSLKFGEIHEPTVEGG
jgi:hypothetical protein